MLLFPPPRPLTRPEPDTFDITRRATGPSVWFRYACVGMAMARLEGEAVLAALTRHASAIEAHE